MSISRDTFDKLKHYVGVRLQQGVPLVDADWNEQEDIRRYELRAFLKWFVGNGVPEGNDGFCILPVTDETGNDFIIKGGNGTAEGAGRCLVEGWDVINESDLKYTKQQLYNNDDLAEKWDVRAVQPIKPPISGTRTDTVYLDVWEREVDADEDGDLVNSAIGIETCVRLKREWVVRVAEGVKVNELPTPSDGHVYYPLASLTRPSSDPAIRRKNITDLRRTGVNVTALTDEIEDARGTKGNLGNRLDESLTSGGQLRHNKIITQINSGEGIINKKNIDSTAGARGWVRLPFLPKRYYDNPEFKHGSTRSVSGSEGAQGVMEIPIPPGANMIKRFRIAGERNDGTIHIIITIGGRTLAEERFFSYTIEGGAQFDELFLINKPLFTPTTEICCLGLNLRATKGSIVHLVAAEFE